MTRWLRSLILVGIIWTATAHPCSAFSNVKGIVVEAANHNSVENLIPLVIKSIGKEHRNFYLQDQLPLFIEPPLFAVHIDVQFARVRIIRGQKSDQPGVATFSARVGHDHIQAEGNGSWVLNLERDFNSVRPIRYTMLMPLAYVHPLPRTPLLNLDLTRKVLG